MAIQISNNAISIICRCSSLVIDISLLVVGVISITESIFLLPKAGADR